MAILGSLIKSAIDLKNKVTSEVDNPDQTQLDQLKWLLKKAKDTSFGIYYGFQEILDSEDPIKLFQERVPIHNYDTLNERWWLQQRQLPNITWPGKPDYFALSSGTTGKESKRIPVTDDMLEAFRWVSLAQIESLSNFDLPPEFFEKDLLMLGSSTDLEENEGRLEGEISGINASNIPSWFENFYKPGLDIAKIDDWDMRVKKIAEKAKEWDVVAIAGIPSWVVMMLQEVIKKHHLKNIHEIWPNLQLFTTGGVAFEPYREAIEKLLDHPITYLDTYLASEGFFSYTARPETMAMKMALNHHMFYEFIPFDSSGFDEEGNVLKNPKVLTVHEVEPDKSYALLVSTPAGAWRYMIGDTVKFTDLEKNEIILSGRTKYFLNVVGSQLSEEKINTAIAQLSEKIKVNVKEFAVSAVKNEKGEYYHQWILGVEGDAAEEQALKQLDDILKELNNNYKVARNKALKYIDVKCVAPDQFYDWLEHRKKKGGQIKVPKVMKEEMMKDFMGFLEKIPDYNGLN